MTNVRIQLFALGYLMALAIGVFAMSAVEVSPIARLTMVVPMAMLAGLTWSAASISRPAIAAALWVAFAGCATSMLIDWHTWEYLGVAAPVAPALGAWLAGRQGELVVAAADPVRRAA